MDVLAYFLYNLAIAIASPFIGGYYLLRLWRRGLPLSSIGERLGFVRVLSPPGPEGRLWLHAVSVGEVGVTAALLPALRKLRPGLRVTISTVTETGREAAEKIEGVECVFYLPFDYRFAVRTALERIKPTALAMVETELWPNLIRQTSLRGVPVAVVNGRLGEKSFRGYQWFKFLFGPAMEMMTGVAARGTDDAVRFRELGAGKVIAAGNIKFDAPAPPLEGTLNDLKKKYGLAEAGPIIVAGSTHPGEELAVGRAFKAIRDRFPDAGLLLAPRHPERHLQDVEAALREAGLSPDRWSALSGDDAPAPDGDRVVILDEMGMLGEAYACGTVAFIGGSLIPHGGQNLIEAGRWGVPVVFGPHMKNFAEEADEFLRVGGAVQVTGADELSGALLRWLDDPEARDRAGASAREVVVKNGGAAARTADFLIEILNSPGGRFR
jgi:3-deoxy-D-manno-octulosonic-acid transferase